MIGIVTMVVIVTPAMIVPTVILGVTFYYLRTIYMSTSQDVKRIEGISEYYCLKTYMLFINEY